MLLGLGLLHGKHLHCDLRALHGNRTQDVGGTLAFEPPSSPAQAVHIPEPSPQVKKAMSEFTKNIIKGTAAATLTSAGFWGIALSHYYLSQPPTVGIFLAATGTFIFMLAVPIISLLSSMK